MTNRTFTISLATAAVLSLGSLSACGLIDSDIADFDLTLPEKDIVLDTSQWELSEDSEVPAVDCSENAGICSLGVSELCGADGICFGSCGASGTCEIKILVSLFHNFDLAKERPELERIEGQPLVKLEINKVAFKVSENTLNVDSPPMKVYVAPADQFSSGDPQAEEIGTLPVIAAGASDVELELELSEGGRASLQRYMKNYTVPFNIIVGKDIDLVAGDTTPTGKLTAAVTVSAVAGI